MHIHHQLPVHSCLSLVLDSFSFLQQGHLKSIGSLLPYRRGTRMNFFYFSAIKNSQNLPLLCSLFYFFVYGSTGGIIFPNSFPYKGKLSPSFYAFVKFWPDDVPPPTATLGALIPGSLLSSSISRFPSSSSSIYCYCLYVPLEGLGGTYLLPIGGNFSSSVFFRSKLELSSSSTYL